MCIAMRMCMTMCMLICMPTCMYVHVHAVYMPISGCLPGEALLGTEGMQALGVERDLVHRVEEALHLTMRRHHAPGHAHAHGHAHDVPIELVGPGGVRPWSAEMATWHGRASSPSFSANQGAVGAPLSVARFIEKEERDHGDVLRVDVRWNETRLRGPCTTGVPPA